MHEHPPTSVRPWPLATLGAVTAEKVLQAGPGDAGEFLYIDIGSIDNQTKKILHPKTLAAKQAPSRAKQSVKAGDVLVSMTRPNLNAVAIVPAELDGAVASTGFHVLRGTDAEPVWLFYAVQSHRFIDSMCRLVQGALYPAVRPKDIRAFPLPLPPLRDQRRIVAEIEKQFTRLDAGVAALKRLQANLKRYRAAVLNAACEGRLVQSEAELSKSSGTSYETGAQLLARMIGEQRRDSRLRARRQSPAHSNLPKLPDGWAWATPEQLAEPNDHNAICAGPFGTIFKAKDFRAAGVPIIFLRHIAPGQYLKTKPGFMDESKWNQLFKPYSVFGGELLITKLGEPPGVCAIYPDDIGPAMVTPDVIKMSVNERAIARRFLMHYFNSENARRFTTGAAFGTTRLRLTIPLFREMPVPLPPRAEQKRIVDEVERRLSVADELEIAVVANLQRAKRLRQSILQRAFSGNL